MNRAVEMNRMARRLAVLGADISHLATHVPLGTPEEMTDEHLLQWTRALEGTIDTRSELMSLSHLREEYERTNNEIERRGLLPAESAERFGRLDALFAGDDEPVMKTADFSYDDPWAIRDFQKHKRYPSDLLGPTHQGHGGLVYQGLDHGHHTFRCNGCGETVFRPEKDEKTAAKDVAERYINGDYRCPNCGTKAEVATSVQHNFPLECPGCGSRLRNPDMPDFPSEDYLKGRAIQETHMYPGWDREREQ